MDARQGRRGKLWNGRRDGREERRCWHVCFGELLFVMGGWLWGWGDEGCVLVLVLVLYGIVLYNLNTRLKYNLSNKTTI